jgi:hypothetical protein
MRQFYDKKLGMIKDIPENRAILVKLGHIKEDKKDDTIAKEPTKQDSGNSKRTKKRPASE